VSIWKKEEETLFLGSHSMPPTETYLRQMSRRSIAADAE